MAWYITYPDLRQCSLACVFKEISINPHQTSKFCGPVKERDGMNSIRVEEGKLWKNWDTHYFGVVGGGKKSITLQCGKKLEIRI